MSEDKQANLSVVSDASDSKTGGEKNAKETLAKKKPAAPPPWPTFLQTASDKDIKQRFSSECKEILSRYDRLLSQYCILALLDQGSSIGGYELDRIFSALNRLNKNREKDILLLLLSTGGSIEPAYQISKLCKLNSKNKFVVAVPRQAKSAATLLAIGADEIHMGPLGQLGPIDPQLGGLPALGVTQALERIAALSERFPGSSDMFARYLQEALTVEQIGYCERISESAAQYAERLLSTNASLPSSADKVAHELVHEYKHHGFVIDLDEARQHLGKDWINTDTEEVSLAEEIYSLLEEVNLFLEFINSKHILVLGGFDEDVLVLSQKK